MKNGAPDGEAKQPAPLPVFQNVEVGIYRYTPNGNYYERSAVNGKRTWRSLKTRNLKFARERLHRRRAGIAEVPPSHQSILSPSTNYPRVMVASAKIVSPSTLIQRSLER